jgi:hypothetical protein
VDLPAGTLRLPVSVRGVQQHGQGWNVGLQFIGVGIADRARLALDLFRTGSSAQADHR